VVKLKCCVNYNPETVILVLHLLNILLKNETNTIDDADVRIILGDFDAPCPTPRTNPTQR
jgi:hypothetical protein